MQDQNTQQAVEEISKRIEAILFWKGEPVSKKDLQKLLSIDEETKELLSKIDNNLDLAIENLRSNLNSRGLCVMEIEDNYTLRTSPTMSSLIEKLQVEELNKDLGKATTETLALIIYKGPIKRSEIDNVRGVNSSYILRNLMIRGLIDKEVDPKNSRTNIYKPSFELLSHLGVTNIANLPNYEEVIKELNKFNEDFNTKQESAE
jgi:segregation and condensation protein B